MKYTVVFCPVVSVRVENVVAESPEEALRLVMDMEIPDKLFDRALDEFCGTETLVGSAVIRRTEFAEDYTLAFVDEDGANVARYRFNDREEWEPL